MSNEPTKTDLLVWRRGLDEPTRFSDARIHRAADGELEALESGEIQAVFPAGEWTAVQFVVPGGVPA